MLDTKTSPGPAFAITRARRDGHTSKLVIHALALAGVNTGADLDTEAPHYISDALGATYGAGRPVECREEAVAGTVDLTSTIALDLLADDCVMPLEEIAPGGRRARRPARSSRQCQ